MLSSTLLQKVGHVQQLKLMQWQLHGAQICLDCNYATLFPIWANFAVFNHRGVKVP